MKSIELGMGTDNKTVCRSGKYFEILHDTEIHLRILNQKVTIT